MADTKPAIDAIALDNLETGLACQWDLLTRLEARPIADIEGLARRLEEVADAVHRVGVDIGRAQVRRPWWWTPALCTVMILLGAGGMMEALWWRPVQTLVCPPIVQTVGPQAVKGRK